LLKNPNFKPPVIVPKPRPKPRKKAQPTNFVLNAHFNSISFEEREKLLQEIATEKYKKKHNLD